MLLRYIVLHGVPRDDEQWARYERWRAEQQALPECQMTEVEGISRLDCRTCGGKPGCPKANRRK